MIQIFEPNGNSYTIPDRALPASKERVTRARVSEYLPTDPEHIEDRAHGSTVRARAIGSRAAGVVTCGPDPLSDDDYAALIGALAVARVRQRRREQALHAGLIFMAIVAAIIAVALQELAR